MSSAGFFEADDIKNGGILFYKSPGSLEREELTFTGLSSGI